MTDTVPERVGVIVGVRVDVDVADRLSVAVLVPEDVEVLENV